MRLQHKRKAFSMLTAIFVIVIMATVGAYVMSLSGKMVKETTAQFQREQAMLLATSYTEYAVMAVMSNDASTQCLQTIQGNNVIRAEASGGFDVSVQIAYIGSGLTDCDLVRVLDATNPTKSIIIDVYVKYMDLDSSNANWITYHKRTLQKI